MPGKRTDHARIFVHPITGERIFTTGSAAAFLGCSTRSVCLMCDRGEIECYRIDRERRIPEGALRAFCEAKGLRYTLDALDTLDQPASGRSRGNARSPRTRSRELRRR